MSNFGSNVVTMGGYPPQNPQNTMGSKSAQVPQVQERKSEGKTSRVIGYSYSVPFFLAAGWYLYLAILYFEKVSGEKTYTVIKAMLAASKITLPSIADQLLGYILKDLWFTNSFTKYYAVHGGVSLILAIQGLFMFNVSFCRINQHSYTALAFGHLGMRSVFRSTIEACKGITALVLAGISSPLISLWFVTSPQFLAQGFLSPVVGVSGKVVAGVSVDNVNYVLALVLLAPVPAAVVAVYSLLTILIKLCAYPYPDRPSSESVWKFGAIFAIFLTLVVVMAGGTIFAIATSSALSTYLGMMISAESTNKSNYKPNDQVGILWMAGRGILGLLYVYPLTGQATQWIANAAFPAKGEQSMPTREELIQKAEVKILEKERIKQLRERKIAEAIQTAVQNQKQAFEAKTDFVKRIANEVRNFNLQQSKGKNAVIPVAAQSIFPPIKQQPWKLPPSNLPNSKDTSASIKEFQEPENVPQIQVAPAPEFPRYEPQLPNQPANYSAPQYTDMTSDSRFAVPYQAPSKSNLLGGNPSYSQRYAQRGQPNQPVGQTAPALNRLPSRFPLLPSNIPQTFTETQDVRNNGESNMTEENLLPDQATEYADPLSTEPGESMRYINPQDAEPDYDLSPIAEVSPGQEDMRTNPVSPASRPPPLAAPRRDSQATMPSMRLPKQPQKLPKYVPGRPSKMTPPTIPVQVGRGPLRIPEGYHFNNPRLAGR